MSTDGRIWRRRGDDVVRRGFNIVESAKVNITWLRLMHVSAHAKDLEAGATGQQ